MNGLSSSGLNNTNHVADINVGDNGKVSGISSRSWTTKNGSTVSSWSQTKIGAIELGNRAARLVIEGVKLTTRAWHDGSGFRKSGDARILTIKAKVGGVSVPIPANPARSPGADCGSSCRTARPSSSARRAPGSATRHPPDYLTAGAGRLRPTCSRRP